MLTLGIAALVLLLSAPEAAPSLEDWVVDRPSWETPAGSYERIVFRNEHGDVRARFAGNDDQIAVAAQAQHHRHDLDRAEIHPTPVAGELRLALRYVAGTAPAEPLPAEVMAKRRVDASIFVPASLDFEAMTRRGLIEAKGIRGDVLALSESGNIVIKASGAVVAETDSGTIEVTLEPSTTAGPARLRTGSGAITVRLRRDADLLIEVETAGMIHSDGIVELTSREDGDRQRAWGRLGEGRRRLLIRSTTGDVTIQNTNG